MKSDRCTRDYKAAVRDAAARFERLDLTGTLDRVWSVIGGRAESDPRKPYNAEAMNAARAQLRQFIETRAEEVRSDLLMSAPSSRPR
jgi:hypothetical protein